MKKFEYLEHTADAKFRAYGKTIEEAFSNAVLALYNIMTDTELVKSKITKKIHVSSKNKRSLLYDFLEKIIVLTDTEGFIPCKVASLEITQGDELKLNAILEGDSADGYDIKCQIKAMTYNDMEINEEKDFFVVQAVPDL